MTKVSPEFRELERLRSIARHNEVSALRHARDEVKLEERKAIVELLKSGKSPEELIREYE